MCLLLKYENFIWQIYINIKTIKKTLLILSEKLRFSFVYLWFFIIYENLISTTTYKQKKTKHSMYVCENSNTYIYI